jgi:hypothetical protein
MSDKPDVGGPPNQETAKELFEAIEKARRAVESRKPRRGIIVPFSHTIPPNRVDL